MKDQNLMHVTFNFPVGFFQLFWFTFYPFFTGFIYFELVGTIHEVPVSGNGSAKCKINNDTHVLEMTRRAIGVVTCYIQKKRLMYQ